ncbi:hypothetical protein QQP08_014461 [Theobroma cacao]|nr:hypothetical protein QQP08_014461 [Theobroma cacao]
MREALVAASVGGEGSVTLVEERDASSRELTVPVEKRPLHDLVHAGEGVINAERTANNARHAQCYVEHGRTATDRNNKKKKSLQKHIIEGSAQEIAHANVDVEKGGFSVDRVENSSNQTREKIDEEREDKAKGIMVEDIQPVTKQTDMSKQSIWRVVSKVGKSGAKDLTENEIDVENRDADSVIPVSNRFQKIMEVDNHEDTTNSNLETVNK